MITTIQTYQDQANVENSAIIEAMVTTWTSDNPAETAEVMAIGRRAGHAAAARWTDTPIEDVWPWNDVDRSPLNAWIDQCPRTRSGIAPAQVYGWAYRDAVNANRIVDATTPESPCP